jgi:hypothetical protein
MGASAFAGFEGIQGGIEADAVDPGGRGRRVSASGFFGDEEEGGLGGVFGILGVSQDLEAEVVDAVLAAEEEVACGGLVHLLTPRDNDGTLVLTEIVRPGKDLKW